MSAQCPNVDGFEVSPLLSTNVWTVMALTNWYNSFAAARSTAIVVNNNGTRSNGKSLWAAQTTGILSLSGDVGATATDATGALVLGNWYSVAMVADGVSMLGYKNGVQVITQTFDSLCLLGVIDIGGAGSAASSGVQVDVWKVWSAALSQQELLLEGFQAAPIRRRNLVLWGHTRTDDAIAQFQKDRSGFVNDMSVIGTPTVVTTHAPVPWFLSQSPRIVGYLPPSAGPASVHVDWSYACGWTRSSS